MVDVEVGALRTFKEEALASLDGLAGIPIPDSLRAKLQPYLVAEARHGREPTLS